MADAATDEKTAPTLSKEEKAVIDALEKLNVVSLNNVVKYMEAEYGISAAAPVAVAAAGGSGGGDGGSDAEEAKSSYNVELADAGGEKIQVIKIVKEATGLGLGEAKALVAGAPKVIKEGMPTAEAEELKKKLEDVGAKVELK